MKTRPIALLGAVAAIALIVAGCGSSDDSTTDSAAGGEALTKAEFVKQANAICTAGNAEIEAALKEGAPKSDEEGEEFVEESVLPAVAKQVEEIGELGYPEGKDGEEAEAVVASAEAEIEKAEDDPSTLAEPGAFKEPNRLAREYGMSVCGEEG